MNNNAIGESWKEVKHEFLTEAERDEIALRVKVISEVIKRVPPKTPRVAFNKAQNRS